MGAACAAIKLPDNSAAHTAARLRDERDKFMTVLLSA